MELPIKRPRSKKRKGPGYRYRGETVALTHASTQHSAQSYRRRAATAKRSATSDVEDGQAHSLRDDSKREESGDSDEENNIDDVTTIPDSEGITDCCMDDGYRSR
jgi:hypothetical protein